MSVVLVLVLVWVLSAVLGYFCTEGAAMCCAKGSWDRSTREVAILCSLLLGPVYLLIAAELLLLAAMGNGMAKETHPHYKH